MLKKYMPFLFLIGLLVLAGCSVKGEGLPSIELNTYQFDLGNINSNNGKVTNEFFITNNGNSDLEIYGVSTSCGCTKAKVDSNVIMPGEKTRMVVTYDPNVHPGYVGDIKRIVYIKSNDPLKSEIELELRGYQQ